MLSHTLTPWGVRAGTGTVVCEAKVGDLEVGGAVLLGEQHILQLEVAVHHALRVQVRDREEGLLHRARGVLLLVDTAFDEHVE